MYIAVGIHYTRVTGVTRITAALDAVHFIVHNTWANIIQCKHSDIILIFAAKRHVVRVFRTENIVYKY